MQNIIFREGGGGGFRFLDDFTAIVTSTKIVGERFNENGWLYNQIQDGEILGAWKLVGRCLFQAQIRHNEAFMSMTYLQSVDTNWMFICFFPHYPLVAP